MNRVELIGNLTKDVELRYTTSQKPIAKFTLAVNERRLNQQTQEWEDDPSFIPIVVFGKQAENCERYLSKGKKAGVSGRIKTGSYQHRDGYTVYTTDVIADSVDFLSPSGQQGYNNWPPQDNYQQPQYQQQAPAPQPAPPQPAPQPQYQAPQQQNMFPQGQQTAQPVQQQMPAQPQGYTALTDEDIPF